MEIDYRKTLELNAILIDKIPMPNNTIGFGAIPYIARIKWKDIISIEEFARTWLIDPSHKYHNAPKVNIITPTMVYTVIADFKEVAEEWDKYIIWASNKSMFNFN